MNRNQRIGIVVVMVAVLGSSMMASAQMVRRFGGGPAAPGSVNLPYMLPQTDAFGNRWMVYPNGYIQQQGNMPVYSQGAMITINGGQPNVAINQARLDDNGELVLENMNAPGCTVTRRILFNTEDGYIRIIDILKNTQAQEQRLNVSFRGSMNYGIQATQTIPDPKRKDQVIGCVAQDSQGRAVVEVFAGRGSKVAPTIISQPNNSYLQASLTVPVPAGKEVAILHLHAVVQGTEAGLRLASSIKEAKLIASLPVRIRKLLSSTSPAARASSAITKSSAVS